MKHKTTQAFRRSALPACLHVAVLTVLSGFLQGSGCQSGAGPAAPSERRTEELNSNSAALVFTGYEPLPGSGALHFERLDLNPQWLSRVYFNPGEDTVFYWNAYRIDDRYKIVHYVSSFLATDTGDPRDYLVIKKRRFPIAPYFHNQHVEWRIFRMYRFNFEHSDYLLLIGPDASEGGNRIIDETVFLVKLDGAHTKVYYPPLNLNYNISNTQPFEPYYFNDFNGDHRLDFLQWNEHDTIAMYSLEADGFRRQPEFIKLIRNHRHHGPFLFDRENSSWPYAWFRADTSGELQTVSSWPVPKVDERNEYYRQQ